MQIEKTTRPDIDLEFRVLRPGQRMHDFQYFLMSHIRVNTPKGMESKVDQLAEIAFNTFRDSGVFPASVSLPNEDFQNCAITYTFPEFVRLCAAGEIDYTRIAQIA